MKVPFETAIGGYCGTSVNRCHAHHHAHSEGCAQNHNGYKSQRFHFACSRSMAAFSERANAAAMALADCEESEECEEDEGVILNRHEHQRVPTL